MVGKGGTHCECLGVVGVIPAFRGSALGPVGGIRVSSGTPRTIGSISGAVRSTVTIWSGSCVALFKKCNRARGHVAATLRWPKATALAAGAKFAFPVTGGKVSLSPLGGFITHSGGILFIDLRTGKKIRVSDFVISLTHGNLTGVVNGNPGQRVALFNLSLAHATLNAGRLRAGQRDRRVPDQDRGERAGQRARNLAVQPGTEAGHGSHGSPLLSRPRGAAGSPAAPGLLPCGRWS